MAVFRVERNRGYTVMSNHHLRNRDLTLKAKGLLSQMLSLPDNWDYTLAGLSRINREKIDAIREAVRELEKAGYIVRSRERDEKGRLRGADYIIYEQPPISDLPTLDYLAIKSLYWSRGGTLKKIMWCDDDGIKPYFMAAGKNLRYGNLRRQIADSLEDKPFPPMPEDWQKRAFFEFGSIEEHMKYRPAVMQAYPAANFPIFADFNHIQYQIRDPKGFADMLISIMDAGKLPELPFIKA